MQSSFAPELSPRTSIVAMNDLLTTPGLPSGFRLARATALIVMLTAWTSVGFAYQPAAGNAKPPAAKAPAVKPAPAEPAEPAVVQLPAAQPPSEGGIHPSMLVEEEWDASLGPPKDPSIKRKLDGYRELIRKGSLNDAQKDVQLIGEVIRYKLSLLTLKKHRDPPPRPTPGLDPKVKDAMEKAIKEFKSQYEIRREIIADITQAGALSGAKEVRLEILKAIVKEIPPLFEAHFSARLHGAILLTEINLTDDPETPFGPTIAPLVKLVTDDTQHDAVRIWAVIGLKRLLTYGQTPAENRSRILTALTKILDRQNHGTKEQKLKHEWFNFRLAEALGWAGTLMVDRKPVVVEVLAQTLVDTEHPHRPRFYAAQALGRLPMDGTINLPMIAVEIARFGQQLATEYTANNQDPLPRMGIFRLYYAFRPETAEDKNRGAGLMTQVARGGLANSGPVVTQAYQNLLPIINAMLGQQPIPKAALDKLNKWLQDNPPKDYRINPNDPSAKPLRTNNVAAEPKKNNVAVRPM